MKSTLLKTLKRTLISIGVLLILAAGAGVGYVWYSGQQGPAIATPAQSTKSIAPVAPTTPEVAPDAPMQASVQTIDSPVMPGQNVTLELRTNPAATCKISVIYDKTPSKDSGLIAKTADERGMVSWTWTVDATAALGTWPVKVTCANQKHSAVVQADLTIAKKVDQ